MTLAEQIYDEVKQLSEFQQQAVLEALRERNRLDSVSSADILRKLRDERDNQILRAVRATPLDNYLAWAAQVRANHPEAASLGVTDLIRQAREERDDELLGRR